MHCEDQQWLEDSNWISNFYNIFIYVDISYSPIHGIGSIFIINQRFAQAETSEKRGRHRVPRVLYARQLRLFTQLLTKQLDLKNAHGKSLSQPKKNSKQAGRDNDETTTWIVFIFSSCWALSEREAYSLLLVHTVYFIFFFFNKFFVAVVSLSRNNFTFCCYHCSTASSFSLTEEGRIEKEEKNRFSTNNFVNVHCRYEKNIFAVDFLSFSLQCPVNTQYFRRSWDRWRESLLWLFA